jgi:AraC-like DNA-binding protein
MILDFFNYAVVPSHPNLQNVVEHYRVTRAKHSTPLILPTYSPIFQGLIFDLCAFDDIVLEKKEKTSLKHKVYFVGQAISPCVFYSSMVSLDIIAVCFTPTGVFQLTGIDLDNFTDQIIDAEAVFGKEIHILYDKIMNLKNKKQALRMIDEFFCLKVKKSKKQNKPCILSSLSMLDQHAGNINVKALQKGTNTTAKTLERSFKSEIGMTPKMYQRLLRFNQAKRYIEENQYDDLWQIAIQFGFYDPSHFISEFQNFAGQTPTEYIHMISLINRQ